MAGKDFCPNTERKFTKTVKDKVKVKPVMDVISQVILQFVYWYAVWCRCCKTGIVPMILYRLKSISELDWHVQRI